MSKRDKPVKKRKRTNWRRDWEDACAELIDCQDALSDSKAETQDARDTVIRLDGYLKRAHESATEECAELMRYRLICDWACQRIEKLECISGTLAAWKEKCTATAGRLRSFEEMFDNLKLQEVGNALNLPLGSTITKEILPGIERLKREKRILLDTLFEVQAENIMQGEDILRQRES